MFQSRPTQIVKVYFYLNPRFLMIIGAQNQLSITICSDLMCIKGYGIRPHTHTFLTINIAHYIRT